MTIRNPETEARHVATGRRKPLRDTTGHMARDFLTSKINIRLPNHRLCATKFRKALCVAPNNPLNSIESILQSIL